MSTGIGILDQVFRLAVFQSAAGRGCVENFCRSLHSFFTGTPLFNEKRATRGLHFLTALGADIKRITPKDKQASILMMEMRSDKLESKLNELGAQWERVFSKKDNRHILAIIPPKKRTLAWIEFEELLTARLKWDKRLIHSSEYGIRSMLVTCEWAEPIDPSSWHEKLFLYSNAPATSFVMHMHRLGFYLGCKQNVCFYDPRGNWKSTGIASEGGHYNDIEAVYEAVKDRYDPRHTWITGTCGGAFAAAHLKAVWHNEGINLILENSPYSMKRDFIEPQCCLVKKAAHAAFGSLRARDIRDEDKPRECEFEMSEIWSELVKNREGRVIVVGVIEDPLLPGTVHEEIVDLAERMNSDVFSVEFESHQKGHSDNYFEHPEPLEKVIRSIFSSL